MLSSTDNTFANIEKWYPKYESQLYTIPGPPSIVQDDVNHKLAFGHKNVTEFLCAVKKHLPQIDTERGFKIHELPFADNDGKYREGETVSTCLYIPLLHEPQVFGFKFIRIMDDRTVEKVSQSIITTLQSLEALLLPLQNDSCQFTKIRITFLIFKTDPPKVSESKKPKQPETGAFVNIFEKIRETVMQSAEAMKTVDVNLKQLTKFSEEEPEVSEAETLLELFESLVQQTGSTENNNPKKEMIRIVLSVNRYLKLPIIDDKISFEQKPRNDGDDHLNLDADGLERFLNSHFQSWKSTLITVPFFDQIKSGLLYRTDKEMGKILTTGVDEYIGEIENFWKEFISLLDNPSGLLLKSYKNQQLNKILKVPFEEEFQFDWLYVSNDQLIVFEIGRSKKLDSPASTIQNKLVQVFTNILPKLQFKVWWFLKHLAIKETMDDTEFESMVKEFLDHHVKVFVYLPNISLKSFKKTLPESWEKAGISQSSSLSWNQVRFLVEPTETCKKLPEFLKLEKTPGGSSLSVTELDSETLKTFLQCHSKQPSPKSSKDSLKFEEYLESIASLCAMGYFLDKGEIANYVQDPLTVDQRFKEDQISFLGKEKLLKGKNLVQLNLTLSPQQIQILERNKKLVLLVGEPGTGKTVELQARAFLATQDPEVSHIYFFSPEVKTSLREKVDEFVNFPEYRENFAAKNYKFLTEKELFGLMDATKEVLHKTVLFLDEVYFEEIDYKELVQTRASEYREKFFQLSIHVFPHLRACWMANIVAPIMRNGGPPPPEFFAGDIFYITPLSVQYRSSKHISIFSSTYLHSYNNAADTSSARTPGCFLSSELEVQTFKYSHREALDFNELNDKLGKKRWAIVFCETAEMEKWENFLLNCGKFSKCYMNSSETGCHDSAFGGGETDSVVMIIDCVQKGSESSSLQKEFSTRAIYSLAITRAQLSLRIYIREDYSDLLDKFTNMRELNETQQILMKARTTRPIDFCEENLELMCPILNQLYHISIKNEDRDLMNNLLDNFPEKKFPDCQPNAELLIKSLAGSFKSKDFLKSNAVKRFKKQFELAIKDQLCVEQQTYNDDPLRSPLKVASIIGLLKRAIDMSCNPLLEWSFGLFGAREENQVKTAIEKFPVLMLQACFKGNVEIMDTLFRKLSHFKLLDNELNRTYNVWNDRTTLLTMLCFCDCKSEAIEKLMNKNFPDNLLLHEFFGKNALQLAIEHNNDEVVKVLLSKPERREKFLSPDVSYGGKRSASEFAQCLGFVKLAIDLKVFEGEIAQ